jgi:polar amino acid transport system substrate-binding protein
MPWSRTQRIVRASLAAILALAEASVAAVAEAAPLRISITEAWGPPFLLSQTSPDAPRAGFIIDWYGALERELGQPLALSYAPPIRTKRRIRENLVDLRCFHSLEWDAEDDASDYVELAQTGLVIEERLIGPSDARPVATLADLDGRRIGTVLGYRYPLLEPAFAAGQARREDALTELAALQKQREGRTDFAVVRMSMFTWLQQLDSRWAGLSASPLVVARTPLHCGVRRDGALSIERLAAAQRRMVASGELDALLRRYGMARVD